MNSPMKAVTYSTLVASLAMHSDSIPIFLQSVARSLRKNLCLIIVEGDKTKYHFRCVDMDSDE